LAYYLSFKSNKIAREAATKRISDVRNFQVLEKKRTKVVGIDVSEYQDQIDWTPVDTLDRKFPSICFIRATVGNDRVDKAFEENLAPKKTILLEVPHYYRPNENSLEQAALFINSTFA
jgi:lysozyme